MSWHGFASSQAVFGIEDTRALPAPTSSPDNHIKLPLLTINHSQQLLSPHVKHLNLRVTLPLRSDAVLCVPLLTSSF